MIYVDDTFPYADYKGKGRLFETFATDEYDDDIEDAKIKWQLDYSKVLGMYRITQFKDNHWNGDIVFNEIKKENAYCPICDKERWIPGEKGYCCECGHHLNAGNKR